MGEIAVIALILFTSATAFADADTQGHISATVMEAVSMGPDENGIIIVPPDVNCTVTGNLVQCDY